MPLKIALKADAPLYTVKSFFSKAFNDEKTKAYKNSHSIKLNLKLWQYIPWISRYLELFYESKRARKTINSVAVKTYIFQSVKDELVSVKSLRFVPKRDNFKVTLLESSAHFIYDAAEEEKMIKSIVENIE